MGLLGAHVSISGGVYKAPERGKKLGCESIQIFSKNQMQWKAKPLTPEDSQKFKEELRKARIKEVVIHDSYLINLGSPDGEKLQMSRDAFLDEMIRTEILGVKYLVFHPGSHMGKGEEIGLKLIAESLNILIDKAKEASNVMLLLETTAGQGSNLGYKFEHLKFIMDQVEKKERLGVCFDTAHAFEAGYDISTEEGYERTFKEFYYSPCTLHASRPLRFFIYRLPSSVYRIFPCPLHNSSRFFVVRLRQTPQNDNK